MAEEKWREKQTKEKKIYTQSMSAAKHLIYILCESDV